VAEEASAGLYTRTQEAASLRQLDAEDVTLRHALDWAMEHDLPTALRLALGQAPMWGIRGRLISYAPLLAEAADDGRRALAVAHQIGSLGLEAVALACLAIAAWQASDQDGALRLVRQAQAIPDEFAGGLDRGLSGFVTMALIEAGDLAGAATITVDYVVIYTVHDDGRITLIQAHGEPDRAMATLAGP
jgi:hypothetical protein